MEVCLPVLDDLVKDYADGVMGQATGAWQLCDAMRQALLAGDVDSGLVIMREVCPSALEDVRLVFRAKKQKFVELLRAGGGPEAALACARSELAPLALDAYPEAYVEFKRLLLLLLLVPPAAHPQKDSGDGSDVQQSGRQRAQGRVSCSSGDNRTIGTGNKDSNRGGSGALSEAESAGIWEPRSTSEFADLAYFTVRSMLGLQQPLLSLQLRFLLRLHDSYTTSTTSPGGTMAAELAPRLRMVPGGGGSDRDPPPLPPLTAPGGGGPPSFPEASMQAVINGAGTSRQAATDAMKRAGGDALSAFMSEVGRLRLNDQLLAELVLEYGSYRGLFSAQQTETLQSRAAGARGNVSHSNAPSLIPTAAAVQQSAGAFQPPHPRPIQDGGQQQQQQQQGPSRPAGTEPMRAGPLSLARAETSRGGESPPNKVPRRSGPADADGRGDEGDGAAEEVAVTGGGPEEMDVEMGEGTETEGGGHTAAGKGDAGSNGRAEATQGLVPGSESGGGASGSGESESGCGSGGWQRPHGQEVLTSLLRLGQEGDVTGVMALVNSVDPGLWDEHPHLLFDVRHCQYAKLLAEGQIKAALELARRELAPLATTNPVLLPLLKSAMAELLPSPAAAPPLSASAGAVSGSASAGLSTPSPVSSLFPSLMLPSMTSTTGATLPAATASAIAPPGTSTASFATVATNSAAAAAEPSRSLPSLTAVVGAIQVVLQPRLGLQGPRLIRLMEGVLASHRAWMRGEKMNHDPFAEAMNITALRAVESPGVAGGPSVVATTAAGGSMGWQAEGAGRTVPPPPPPGPPPPPPLPALLSTVGFPTRALERALRETGTVDRGDLLRYQLDQQILAEIRSELPQTGSGAAAAGALFGGFPGGIPVLVANDSVPRGRGGRLRREQVVPIIGYDEDDESGGGGGGMEVDEEGVLRLMEILELPRSAAIGLLQNHDGDVQAAILSVTQ